LPQHYLHAANMYEIQKARLLRAPAPAARSLR
jgi:hypothetical protein